MLSNSIAGVYLRIVTSSINPSQALAGCKGLLTPEQTWRLPKDKGLCGPTQDLLRPPNSLVLHVSIRLRSAIGGSVVVSHLSKAVAPGRAFLHAERAHASCLAEGDRSAAAAASSSKNLSYHGKPSVACATYGASKKGDALCVVAHLVGQSRMVVLTYRGHSRATTLHQVAALEEGYILRIGVACVWDLGQCS